MNDSDAQGVAGAGGAAGAGAGAAGAAGAGGGAGSAAAGAGGRLPLRGVAMVLISVAILLGLWGIFALTSSDDSTATNTAESTQHAASGQGEPGAGGANNGGGNDGAGAPADGQHRDGQHGDGQHGDGQHGDGHANADHPAGEHPAGAAHDGARPEGAPAPGGERPAGAAGAGSGSRAGAGAGARQNFEVTVLNNSTVSGLAHRVTQSLEREGLKTRESGNLPGGDKVLPENTVFFPAGNAAAEQRARELADRVGGIARENTDYLPREATDNDGLTMVLVGEVAL